MIGEGKTRFLVIRIAFSTDTIPHIVSPFNRLLHSFARCFEKRGFVNVIDIVSGKRYTICR